MHEFVSVDDVHWMLEVAAGADTLHFWLRDILTFTYRNFGLRESAPAQR